MKKTSLLLVLGIMVFLSSCKKDDSTPNAPQGEYYYEATIGGVVHKVHIPVNNMDANLEAGSSLGGLTDVVFGAGITNSGPGGTHMGITKGVMHNYFDATQADFMAFFAPNNYTYAPYGSDGVTVGWEDENGTYWDSGQGTAEQNGSTFTILSISEVPSLTGTLYIKATIQFNCKLYDDNGNVKQASGTFVGMFGMI